jgi:hypothetical protein
MIPVSPFRAAGPSTAVPPVGTGTVLTPDARADDAGLCDVCPHLLASHDTIGLRFCRATIGGAMTRGCICSPA